MLFQAVQHGLEHCSNMSTKHIEPSQFRAKIKPVAQFITSTNQCVAPRTVWGPDPGDSWTDPGYYMFCPGSASANLWRQLSVGRVGERLREQILSDSEV